QPGVDFVRAIEKAVGDCHVLLALIGSKWASMDTGVQSRLDDPKDFIRLEISTALARDIRVIPVLVDGVKMPSEDTLPAPLNPRVRCNAIDLSNTRFGFDVERLITAVRSTVDEIKTRRSRETEEFEPQRWWQTTPGFLTATAGAIIAVVGLIVALQMMRSLT